jgi:hypothetical protein
MNTPPVENISVKVRGKDIMLDPKNMSFNELTLSEYMMHEYGWIDYFGKQLEFAEADLQLMRIDYDAAFNGKYADFKAEGCTEGQAKAKALSDPDVIAIRQKMAKQDETVGLIKQHLRAWDKNHENAQSRGHFIRKEMDKLNKTIYATDASESTGTYESFKEESGS